jgi:hypothetical protein
MGACIRIPPIEPLGEMLLQHLKHFKGSRPYLQGKGNIHMVLSRLDAAAMSSSATYNLDEKFTRRSSWIFWSLVFSIKIFNIGMNF